MDPLPPPQWLRSFEAAARLGGFAAAAAELGMTSAAVSQQIRALEQRLGYKLFDRLARGVVMTEMGQAYLPPVRRGFAEIATATAGLFGAGHGAEIVVRSPPSFAVLALAPRLAAFHAAHPELRLRLSTSIWADAAREGSVDVDIRYGAPGAIGPAARRLTEPVSLLVVPPDAPRATVRDWARRAIHVAGCESLWAQLLADRPDVSAAGTPGSPACPVAALSADSSLVALELVAAGLGAALIARDLARPALEARRVALCTEAGGSVTLVHDQAHHVHLGAGDAASPAARLFRDWLLRAFAERDARRADGVGA